MKTISIIGTGAIGGYCAVKLHQAGFDVHCLFGHDYDAAVTQGLTLIEPDGSRSIAKVQAYSHIQQLPISDFVIVALKTTANSLLENHLRALLKPNGSVVVLQNGIGMEAQLAKYIPADNIIGGICYIKATKTAPAVINHFGFNTIELAQFYLNEAEEQVSEKVNELTLILRQSGIEANPMPHLPTIRWKKLSGNIATSGLSIVLNASHHELVENPASLYLLKEITREAINAATKSGARLPADFFDFRLKVFESFKTMEKHNSSMKDDFDAKKPIEIETIYRNALNIAEEHGVDMPFTKMLYLQLLYMTANNQK